MTAEAENINKLSSFSGDKRDQSPGSKDLDLYPEEDSGKNLNRQDTHREEEEDVKPSTHA